MARLGGMLLLLSGIVLAMTSGVSAEDQPERKKGGRDPEALFKRLDTNGDSKLDRNEFLKLAERIAQGRAKQKGEEVTPEQVKAIAEAAFKRLDANGDGTISLEELKKGREQRRPEGKKRQKDA